MKMRRKEDGKSNCKAFCIYDSGSFGSYIYYFMLSFASAGDAARVLAEKKYEHPSPEQVEEVRHEEGLDQPILVQYGKCLNQALHGDFGKSYSTRKPAFEELKRYFPRGCKKSCVFGK